MFSVRSYGLEFTAVDSHQVAPNQAGSPTEPDKRAACRDKRCTVVSAKISDGFKVRSQSPQQPHDFDVALALSLQPPGGTNLLEITVEIEFEQVAGVVRRPSGCFWNGFVEPQLLKVQQGNIGLYHPNQMVFGNELIQ